MVESYDDILKFIEGMQVSNYAHNLFKEIVEPAIAVCGKNNMTTEQVLTLGKLLKIDIFELTDIKLRKSPISCWLSLKGKFKRQTSFPKYEEVLTNALPDNKVDFARFEKYNHEDWLDNYLCHIDEMEVKGETFLTKSSGYCTPTYRSGFRLQVFQPKNQSQTP